MKKIFILAVVAVISISAYCYQDSNNNLSQSHSVECGCCQICHSYDVVANSAETANNTEVCVSMSPSEQNTYGYKTCYMCHGSGKCNTCNGKGWYYSPFGTGKIACPNCTDGKCRTCNGSGKVYGILR